MSIILVFMQHYALWNYAVILKGLIIFPIFESVITDITVDYSASGSPFFFKSGAPTSVALSLTIMEITSRVRGDYQASRSGFA